MDGLVHLLIKIIIMIVFVTLVYIDSICRLISRLISRFLNEWKLYFEAMVEVYINEEALEIQKMKIIDDIESDFESFLLVWCPIDSFDPEFIVTTFGSVYPDVAVTVNWNVCPPFSSGRISYGRVIADFNSGEVACLAARELANRTRCMPVVAFRLSQIMEIVINAELRHPMLGSGPTRLLLRSKRRISGRPEKERVKVMLYSCGNVTSVHFHSRSSHAATMIVCEATYEYASQAYLAKFMMDGLFYKPLMDRFSVTIIQTEKEKHIERTLRRRLSELMDESRVVPF